LVFLVIGAALACKPHPPFRPTPTSDEFLRVEDNASAAGAVKNLAERAPFDLDCPAEQLTYKKLGSVHNLGVTGCGKRATYVMTSNGYVLNSTITEAASREAEPAEAPPVAK
jgi:hypothetical protein